MGTTQASISPFDTVVPWGSEHTKVGSTCPHSLCVLGQVTELPWNSKKGTRSLHPRTVGISHFIIKIWGYLTWAGFFWSASQFAERATRSLPWPHNSPTSRCYSSALPRTRKCDLERLNNLSKVAQQNGNPQPELFYLIFNWQIKIVYTCLYTCSEIYVHCGMAKLS
jgi:hypothetical protein